jgi:N-acetylglucosaminyldiphosphoundecaprenol N-acetyl-beta-D-mannosaminyltransferase
MQPREIPMAPRASIREVLRGRARLVGSRTAIGRDDLHLPPGVISPYEAREAMGLRYGDPVIEEARYERKRTSLKDAGLVARWVLTRLARRDAEEEAPSDRPYVVSAKVDALDTSEAIRRILRWLSDRRGGRVFFVHPHALNLAARDPELRRELQSADMVLPDGVGLRVAATLLGVQFPANVNGTDLIPELLIELAAERIPVALIGGAEGVAERAAQAWKRSTGVNVVGAWHGFASEAEYRAIAKRIAAAGPCVVLVAMGTPHQERFVARYLADLPQAVSITVGGLLDFASGEKVRAPIEWRELGLEWAWRLVHEPKRLGKRYLLGNPEFVFRAFGQAVAERASHLRRRGRTPVEPERSSVP